MHCTAGFPDLVLKTVCFLPLLQDNSLKFKSRTCTSVEQKILRATEPKVDHFYSKYASLKKLMIKYHYKK